MLSRNGKSSKYPLQRNLEFAKTKVSITKEEQKIIYHAQKFLLFKDQKTWLKKAREPFDVAIGAYDGDEICELVALFMQTTKQIVKKISFGSIRRLVKQYLIKLFITFLIF